MWTTSCSAFLIESRELPLSGGADSWRAGRTLGSPASRRTRRKAHEEVRCWSDADWRRVVREDNAWTVESDDPDALYGWLDDDYRSDPHAPRSVQPCSIAIGPRGRARVGSRRVQVEAADSVTTFVHEIQHLVLPDADEGEVECAAAAELSRFARRLGATSVEAARLAQLYVTDLREELDDEYRADCDDAG